MQHDNLRRVRVAGTAAVSSLALILILIGAPLVASEALPSTPRASPLSLFDGHDLDPSATPEPFATEFARAPTSSHPLRTATPTPTLTDQLVRRRSTSTNPVVDLQLAPVTWPVLGRNQTLATDIVIRAGPQPVTVVAIYLDFDPTRLQVTSLEFVGYPENPINIPIQLSYRNVMGRIDISAGVFVTTSTPGTGY